MKSEELALAELLDLSEGRFDLHGRRLVLHSSDAMARAERPGRDGGAGTGPPLAHAVRQFLGPRADAAAMKRIFHWNTIEDWLKAGPRMHTLQGVARVTVKLLDAQPAAGRFHMEVTWHDSAEADEQRLALGQSLEPVCWTMVGYASGYASFCTGLEVFFIEDKCRGKGDRICSAVGRDRQSWGGEIEPHVAYFHADDIQGRPAADQGVEGEDAGIARRAAALPAERVVGRPPRIHSSASGR